MGRFKKRRSRNKMGSNTVSSKNELQLRESNPTDSENLNRFFSNIPVEGKIKLKIKRHFDFFSFYRRLGLQFTTYLFENSQKEEEILGTASFLFQERLVFNQKAQIAYACDLRISPQRRAILNWSKFFLPLLNTIKNEKNIKYFITSINLTGYQAINAFLRPRNTEDHLPIYELIEKFNLVSIHGFLPFLFSTQKGIQTSFYTESDKTHLINYIKKQLLKYELVPTSMLDDLENYIQASLIYSFQNFIVAKNIQGEIIGCTHPISSSLMQDYFPQQYDHQSNNFRQFLKFVSFLGWGRTLTKPFSRTNKEQTLNFKVLHFLFTDHPEVLKSILNFAYKSSIQNEFLIYATQDRQYNQRPPHGTIYSKIPYGLFEIRSPETVKNSRIKFKKSLFLDYLWF